MNDHIRRAIFVVTCATALGSLGCANEAHDPEEIAALLQPDDHDDELVGYSVCNAHDEAESCLAAGCLWSELFGVALDDENTCEPGPAWGLCFATSGAQPCNDTAMQCGDGSYAWVLPAPDNAMVITRSESSCSVPEHFLPCPTGPGANQRLRAPDAGPIEVSSGELSLARACSCGCNGPG